MNLQPKSSEMEKLTCLSLWEWFPRLLQVHFRTLYYFFGPWPQPDLHTHRANIMENYRWYSLNSLEYGITTSYPCKNTPVSLLYSHYLCVHSDLGTTAWVRQNKKCSGSCPVVMSVKAAICNITCKLEQIGQEASSWLGFSSADTQA